MESASETTQIGLQRGPTVHKAGLDPTKQSDADQGQGSTSQEEPNFASLASVPGNRKDDLVSILQDTLLDRKILVQAGKAPFPLSLGILPSGKDGNKTKKFSSLMGMMAILRLLAAVNEMQAQEKDGRLKNLTINNPGEAGRALADRAKAMYHDLTIAPLGSLFSLQDEQTLTVNQSIKCADIRRVVLETAFDGMDEIELVALERIDDLLAEFISDLKPYKVSKTVEQPSVNLCMLIHYLKEGLEGGQAVLEPCTRMVFVDSRTETWFDMFEKANFKSDEEVQVLMEITIVDIKLNEEQYRAMKPNLEDMFDAVAQKNEDLKAILDEGGIERFGRSTSVIV
ncbi:hypothetical protein CC78DRAFT_541898 [Lojkania enalia]|uniref:Uncharacterized protein n=1 Tax=Lojkania enalia TaxID=147567 RepID=A0A9P4KGG1_9PLEO|nr:hypothetical protein CC78DRAFT_541898 [Didymosphaeria enalia]